jgi:modification methylase
VAGLKTIHRIVYGDSAGELRRLPRESVDLLVTSPPYPMIEMWDDLFCGLEPDIRRMLDKGDGDSAHAAMCRVLDEVWMSADRCVKRGGMLCVNMGDATRTVGGTFKLYPNHSSVGASLLGRGYDALPEILWRKTSNKPNKFMGSGMLPPGAYVTQEHEYIMTYRKSGSRRFTTEGERANRRKSGYFWEERNVWFSDLWGDLRGERQSTKGMGPRARSAAFPFELAHRLVCMFSVQNDLVLDPFAGTGMTTLAAMVAGRNSVAIELDPRLRDTIESRIGKVVEFGNRHNEERLRRHLMFSGGRPGMRHRSQPYGFPVMTRQETTLQLPVLSSVSRSGEGVFEVEYSDEPTKIA